MDGELLRIVDAIHRDKNIDKEIVFQGIEQALLAAARKHFHSKDSLSITIDRETGKIAATDGEEEIDPVRLGRVAAQTAKQVIIQKIREAEGDSLFDEYVARKTSVVNGSVQRFEGGTIIVNLGKLEGVLPRSEQIPTETYHIGERIRAYVLDVRKVGHRVKVILSRSHPEFIRRLFEIEVPEVAEKTVEVKGIAREAGYRTKISVSSIDLNVDCVGACVGVRGTRIKNIVDELNGEKIDIIRWNESSEVFITNGLKPAEISEIVLHHATRRAHVVVPEDQLSLAIGKRGQNVRLAVKLSKWDINIVTETELEQIWGQAFEQFSTIPGVGEKMAEKLYNSGLCSLADIADAGVEILQSVDGLGPKKAEEIVQYAAEHADDFVEEEPPPPVAQEEPEAEEVEEEPVSEEEGLQTETREEETVDDETAEPAEEEESEEIPQDPADEEIAPQAQDAQVEDTSEKEAAEEDVEDETGSVETDPTTES